MKSLLIGTLVSMLLNTSTTMTNPTPSIPQETIDNTNISQTNRDQDNVFSKISESDYQSLFADAKKSSNPQAQVYVIEYSDLECPFCKKFHKDEVIERLAQHYPITHVVKHFPLNFHSYAQSNSQFALCVYKFHWLKTYNTILDKLFEAEDMSTKTHTKLIQDYKLNAKNIQSCIDSKLYAPYIATTIQQASKLFNISGTPSTVMINMQTKEYTIIEGAWPYETFEEAYLKLIQKS